MMLIPRRAKWRAIQWVDRLYCIAHNCGRDAWWRPVIMPHRGVHAMSTSRWNGFSYFEATWYRTSKRITPFCRYSFYCRSFVNCALGKTRPRASMSMRDKNGTDDSIAEEKKEEKKEESNVDASYRLYVHVFRTPARMMNHLGSVGIQKDMPQQRRGRRCWRGKRHTGCKKVSAQERKERKVFKSSSSSS